MGLSNKRFGHCLFMRGGVATLGLDLFLIILIRKIDGNDEGNLL